MRDLFVFPCVWLNLFLHIILYFNSLVRVCACLLAGVRGTLRVIALHVLLRGLTFAVLFHHIHLKVELFRRFNGR